MKSVILLLCLMLFAPFAASAQWYRHKSEEEIARMTPAEHLAFLPSIIKVIDEYAPTKRQKGGNGKRFETAYLILISIDNTEVRLRASKEGRRAIVALERATQRMRAAGYAVKKDGYDWNHGLLVISEADLEDAKGINNADRYIQNTFWFVYKIKVLNAELLEFSNYLTEHHPEHPNWSERTSVENREESPDGFSVKYISFILKNPERYREAYLEFKKTK